MLKAARTLRPVVPAFTIVVDGATLPGVAAAHVRAVTVDDDVDLPGMFAFDLAGTDERNGQTGWPDSPLFKIGAAVELKLGYVEKVDTVMIGEITALEPEFGADHLANLTVRGFDVLHRLQRGRWTRTFTQQKDSDVAERIASERKLGSDIVDSAMTHDYLVQQNETDFEFLSRRARAIGYELRGRDRTLSFRPRTSAAGGGVKLSLQSDLLEFMPRLSTAGQVDDVIVRSWSVKDKQILISEATAFADLSPMGQGARSGPSLAASAFTSAPELISGWTAASHAEADRFARARLADGALEFVTGDGTCWGRSDLRAGTIIEIVDVGTRFSGPYYVTRARHRYSARDGYVVDFSVRRNAS
jgi:phage protein D